MLELPNGDKITFDFYLFGKGKLLPTELASKSLAAGKLKNKQTVCVYKKIQEFWIYSTNDEDIGIRF